MIDHANISNMFASIINARYATMRELQEYYSIEDVHNMYEVVLVDSYNQKVLS